MGSLVHAFAQDLLQALKRDSKEKKIKPDDKGQCRGASDKLDQKDSVRGQRGDKARKTWKPKQQPCKYVPVDAADGAPFAHADTRTH